MELYLRFRFDPLNFRGECLSYVRSSGALFSFPLTTVDMPLLQRLLSFSADG
jgi:hypothetical protein